MCSSLCLERTWGRNTICFTPACVEGPSQFQDSPLANWATVSSQECATVSSHSCSMGEILCAKRIWWTTRVFSSYPTSKATWHCRTKWKDFAKRRRDSKASTVGSSTLSTVIRVTPEELVWPVNLSPDHLYIRNQTTHCMSSPDHIFTSPHMNCVSFFLSVDKLFAGFTWCYEMLRTINQKHLGLCN